MTAISWLRGVWEILTVSPRLEAAQDESQSLDFVPDAELVAYLEGHPAPIAADLANLPPSSAPPPGATLLVPLVSQRQLVGLLSLGAPRESKAYSADEVLFVATLADEAAAAARIAQLRSAHAVPQLTGPRGT